MLHMQAAIDIRTSPGEVFQLLCDAELKTRLNPDIELLHVALVTPGPLQPGSRIQYRLRHAGHTSTFHCEVTAYETNRLIEWRSDTRPAFRVRQVLEPTATGCRLIHDEWLDTVTPDPVKPARWSLVEVARAFQQATSLDLSAATTLVADPDEAAQESMHASLTRWLENIRSHLEQPRLQPGEDLHTIATIAF